MKERPVTDRIPVTLSLATIAYLETLRAQGTHGGSVPAVIRTMVEESVRRAIVDGLLDVDRR